MSRDPVGYRAGINLHAGSFAQYGSVDPSGCTRGKDFIWIFIRRMFRFTAATDWAFGQHYYVADSEGTIIGQNVANSTDFVRKYARENVGNIPKDGNWHHIHLTYIHDIRSYTGEWLVRSNQIWGDGGYWLNGATGIAVESGFIEVRKCCFSDEMEIGDFHVNYIWRDDIDANSFVEAWDEIRQGNVGAVVEALLGDIVWDKVLDMDYSVSIRFYHAGSRRNEKRCK